MNALPQNSEEKRASIKQTQQENEYRGNINLVEEKRGRKSQSEIRKGANSNEFQQTEQNKHADNNDAKPYKNVINSVDMPEINLQRDEVKLNKNKHVLNNLPPLSTTTPRSIFNSNSRDREHRLGITQSPIPFTHNQVKCVESAEIERAKQLQNTYADNKEPKSRANTYNINYGDTNNTTPSTTSSNSKIKEYTNCRDANNGSTNSSSDNRDNSKRTSSLSENAHINANRLPTHYNSMKSTSSEPHAVCHDVNVNHNNNRYVESGKRYSGDSNTSGGYGNGLDNNNSSDNNKKNMLKGKRITPHSLTAQHNSRNEALLLESPISLTSSLHETHSNTKDLYSDADSMIDIGSLKSDTKEHSNTVHSSSTNHSHHSNTYSKGSKVSKVNCFDHCPEQEPNYGNILQKKLLVNNYIDHHHHHDKDRVGETRKSVSKTTGSTFASDQSSRGTSTATHCLTETSPSAHNQSISHVSSSCRANSDGFDICSKSSKNNIRNRDVGGMCTVNMENVPSKSPNANISKTESSSSVALQPHSRGNSGLVQSTWVESTLPKSPNVRCTEPEMVVAAASSSRSIQTPLANSGSRLSSPCYNRAMISTPTSISSSVNRVVSTGTRTPRTREPGSASTPRSLSFQRGNTLGSGGFGTVFQAILPDGTLAAVKELKLETNNTAAIDNEMRTMSSLPPHPNCVHYFGARYSKHHYYLIMEYISGGSIHSLRKTYGAFREPIFQSYAYMVLEGLYHLHQHGIIHRDIKGANVLLDEHGVAKIVDFGCCKDLNQGNTTLGGGGTPLWMAPEVCRGEGATMKSDVWSFGCLCLEMTNESGQPWNFPPGMNLQGIAYAIAQANKPPAIPLTLSPLAIDMISHCLKLDPMERMSVNELLNHPFFQVDFFNKQAKKNGNGDEDEDDDDDDDDDDGFILSNEPSAINQRCGENGSRVIEHEVTVNSDDTVQCNSANVVNLTGVVVKNAEPESTTTNVITAKEGGQKHNVLLSPPQQGTSAQPHMNHTLVDSEDDENATFVLNKRSLRQSLPSTSTSTSMNFKFNDGGIDDSNSSNNIKLENSAQYHAMRYVEAKKDNDMMPNTNVATNTISAGDTNDNSATSGKSNNNNHHHYDNNNTSLNHHISINNNINNKGNSDGRSKNLNYNYTNSVNAENRNEYTPTSHSGGNRVVSYQRVNAGTNVKVNNNNNRNNSNNDDGSCSGSRRNNVTTTISRDNNNNNTYNYQHHEQEQYQQPSTISIQGKLLESELALTSSQQHHETPTIIQSPSRGVDLNSTLMLNVTDDMDDNDLIEDIIQHARSNAGSVSHESRSYHSHAFHQYPLNSEASSLENSSYESSDSSLESSYSNTNSSTRHSSSGLNSSYSTNMSSDNGDANAHHVESQVGDVVHGAAGQTSHPAEHNTLVSASSLASAPDRRYSETINKSTNEIKYSKEQAREPITREFSDSDVETPNVSQTRIGRRIVEQSNNDGTLTNTQKDAVTQNSFSSTAQNNNNLKNNNNNNNSDKFSILGLAQENAFTYPLTTLPLPPTPFTKAITKSKCVNSIVTNAQVDDVSNARTKKPSVSSESSSQIIQIKKRELSLKAKSKAMNLNLGDTNVNTVRVGNNANVVENSTSNSNRTRDATSHNHADNREEWPTHSIIWETTGAGSVNKELSSQELVPTQLTGKYNTKINTSNANVLFNVTSTATTANTTTNTNTDSDTSNALSSSSNRNSEMKTVKERKPLKVFSKWFKGS